jgi:hypothetical protein
MQAAFSHATLRSSNATFDHRKIERADGGGTGFEI